MPIADLKEQSPRFRPHLAALPFLLALAACERQPYEKSDGSFERDAYRNAVVANCRASVSAGDRPPPATLLDAQCACVADRILAQDDAQLRAQVRDGSEVAAQRDALSQCGGDQADADVAPPDGLSLPPETLSPAGSGDKVDVSAAAAPGATRARARAELDSYFSADDYPAAALRDAAQGPVGVELDVSPDGRVAACRVVRSSGSASLDSATCRILRSRARYQPARDAQGALVPDRDTATITWTLPRG